MGGRNMKKALLITLIALMSCMLMTTALAADFTTPGEYVKHVSFDEFGRVSWSQETTR